ncbi:hypothetical protein SAMN05216167_102203 [Spirosoma endophyticum]|uniref:Uncharacterized protein n=1 Tax=Spirosoma endophyticum TaxID=662367 RepID=A0A1I1LCR6_9BACT|nr:hypothetical protein SAMN05216167_102203 [Spirosoma endophyticum]
MIFYRAFKLLKKQGYFSGHDTLLGESREPTRLRLVKMAYSLPVQRGVHTLPVVR